MSVSTQRVGWAAAVVLAAAVHAGACAQGIGDDSFGDDDDTTTATGGSGGGLPCPAGETRCGDTCVDTASDPEHCGGCDHACGESASCANGSCECGGLTQDCGDGCVDIGTDIYHCGGCNSPCAAAAHAGAACVGGICGLDCASGWGDCDGDLMNGCETGTDANVEHCGECDNPCPTTVDHGTAVCQGGTCTLSCDPDWDDCDVDIVTGCETDLTSDPDHCSACNNPCQQDWICYQSTCMEGCPPTIPGFSGEIGPNFSPQCWKQCEGYLDQPGGDEIPLTWGDDCMGPLDNTVRIVCGASVSSYRYIDVSKNPFRDGLASYPESGLIVDARDQNGNTFSYSSNDIYADGNHPHVDTSWWAGGDGCTGSATNLTVNNIPGSCTEAENCFGQAIAGARYLWVYVKE